MQVGTESPLLKPHYSEVVALDMNAGLESRRIPLGPTMSQAEVEAIAKYIVRSVVVIETEGSVR